MVSTRHDVKLQARNCPVLASCGVIDCPQMTTDDAVMTRQHLADYVRTAREEAGLTVVAAADAARVSRTRWTAIESAEPPIPKGSTLGKIAGILGRPFDELAAIARGDVTPPDDDDLRTERLLARLDAMDDALRKLEARVLALEPTEPRRVAERVR
jgi:transcriptional regulator with XRE-family HTH domain